MDREMITMTRKEQQRAMVLNQVQQRRLLVSQAAEVLALSTRHTKRLLAAYRRRGPAALVHGNRGRPPAHALPEAVKARVRTLAQAPYAGLNHTHFTELPPTQISAAIRARKHQRHARPRVPVPPRLTRTHRQHPTRPLPRAEHPWRRFDRAAQYRKALREAREAGVTFSRND